MGSRLRFRDMLICGQSGTQLRVLPPKMEFSYVFLFVTVSLGPSDV